MSFIDNEAVENLKRSLSVVGQIYAVIVDEDGDIISGKHRALAGAPYKKIINIGEAARRLGVSKKAAKIIYRMHSNVQRKVSAEETKSELLALANELEAQGVPKDKIAAELVKWAPYSERYIRELLPEEYKQAEKRSKTPQELSEEDKVWLASVIDANGIIYRDKNGDLWLKVRSTDRSLIERVADILEVNVSEDRREGELTYYVASKHGTKSVEAILKQIEPHLKDKRDAVKKLFLGTAELVPLYPSQGGADTQVSSPSATQITQPSQAAGQTPQEASSPAQQPTQQSSHSTRFNPAASEVVRMIKDGIEGGLFTWRDILAAMDLTTTLELAAAYRETLTPGSQCPVCGSVVGPDDIHAKLRLLESRWGRRW